MVLLNLNKINQIVSAVAIVFFSGIIGSCNLNPVEENSDAIIINFPDPNFEALVREILEIPTRDITNNDMWSIKEIIGIGREITDLSGIEYCTGLQMIYLRDNYITNLEPITELILLNYINLQDNLIVDILPLVNNLGIGVGNDIIIIYNNPLSDESILQYKPQLQLKGVEFYSNAALANPGEINFMDSNFEEVIREHLNKPNGAILNTDLESITNIYGRNRNITNIYGIEFCTNLDTLDLGENQISDIIPLFYLRNMISLKLNNNYIEDIRPLRYFFNLTVLVISNNKIVSISFLSELTQLTSLFLNDNNIQDITPLINLLNLKYLTLSGNPIDNLELIENLGSLNGIELINLNQFDFSYIKDLNNLQALYLTNTPVINLDQITSITSLKALIMINCDLTNIYSLANLNNLTKLLLNYNSISDITSITDLHELYELNLSNNNISDILPLVNNWGLSGSNDYVLLYSNPLSATSINTYIPQLQDRGVLVFY